MDKTKKILAILGAVITLIAAILGSGAVFDFSNTSTIISDDSTTITNEGDTVLGIDKDILKGIARDVACEIDPELCG